MPTAHLYDPLDPTYLDAADARAERDRTFQICSRLPDLRAAVPELQGPVPDDRRARGRRSRTSATLTDDEHQTSSSTSATSASSATSSARTRPTSEQEWVVDFPRLMLRSLARSQDAGGEGRRAAPSCSPAPTCREGRRPRSPPVVNKRQPGRASCAGLMEKTTGIAKDRLLPTFAKVRFSQVVRRPPRRSPRRSTRGTVALFPTCLVEYQEPADRRGARRRVRAQRHRLRAARGSGVLRHAVARRRRRRQVPEHAATQRRRARAGREGRAGRRRAPADVRVRAEERVPRLPRHRRRQARRRAHLRRVGVPDGPAPRAAARHRLHRHHLRHDHLAGGVPLPRAADRPEEPRPHGAHRRQGADGRALLGDRRHVGAAGRERRDGAAGRQAADGGGPGSRTPSSSPATATSRTPRSPRAPDSRPCTRCRCWPAPTACPRSDHEQAHDRRHQGPARVRARARRVPAAHRRDEEAASHRARRPPDDRVREHRHDAVPDPGDGARRAHADRRADRATRSRRTTS